MQDTPTWSPQSSLPPWISSSSLFLRPQTAPSSGSPTSVHRTMFSGSFQVGNLSVTFHFYFPLPHIQLISKSPRLPFPNATQIHPGPGPIQGTQAVGAGVASPSTSGEVVYLCLPGLREMPPSREGPADLASSGEGKQAWNRTVDRLQAAILGRFDNTHKERVRAR